jgi:hypothetical protein
MLHRASRGEGGHFERFFERFVDRPRLVLPSSRVSVVAEKFGAGFPIGCIDKTLASGRIAMADNIERMADTDGSRRQFLIAASAEPNQSGGGCCSQGHYAAGRAVAGDRLHRAAALFLASDAAHVVIGATYDVTADQCGLHGLVGRNTSVPSVHRKGPKPPSRMSSFTGLRPDGTSRSRSGSGSSAGSPGRPTANIATTA